MTLEFPIFHFATLECPTRNRVSRGENTTGDSRFRQAFPVEA
jgi:hypothetical protein